MRDQRELEVQRAAKALISGTPYQPASENEIRTRAALYAIGTGLANAAVEVSGGLETLPGELKGGGAWAALRDSMAHEGGEEVIQGSLGRGLKNAVYDAGAPVFSVRDENAILNPVTAMKEFAGGAAVGGILGGAQVGIGRAAGRLYGREAVSPEKGVAKLPRISMEDFTNNASPVWTFLEYGDETTQSAIMRKVNQEMVDAGEVVQIPDTTIEKTAEYYPDMRGVKKAERVKTLKEKMSALKGNLRQFLNGLKGSDFELEVNGNILEARLYGTGIAEAMEKITQDKASMLFHSDDIFRKARYLYSTPDYDGDPNIYRWNYFYTPVQIGEHTVGVRIAVRDVKKPMESQIYNWNIKKDALLDGDGRGQTRIPTGVSSSTSSGGTASPESNITGMTDLVKPSLDSQIDTVDSETAEAPPSDPVKLYQQLLTEASTAKRIETLAEYYRKYVGDPSGRGAKGVDSAAFGELEKAYREAMGLGQYNDETFQELKRLYEWYLGNPTEKMEDEN